ncbi:hypothetical protein PCC7424_5807 (plasmid) [Gloeothece citriformis PCC 7424]|uniref:Uncharacterized protein n=1 Tax=Gloeothece citriformis (strain PCC 7424) TaxID=65393 RepID=B7KM46_GLOC7|nr:hypothetical protein [Gloeothece citriformis]ACK73868.1 hypothetical protein PCC7424_5807 [Gloeothece citriformis PCC 7424]
MVKIGLLFTLLLGGNFYPLSAEQIQSKPIVLQMQINVNDNSNSQMTEGTSPLNYLPGIVGGLIGTLTIFILGGIFFLNLEEICKNINFENSEIYQKLIWFNPNNETHCD